MIFKEITTTQYETYALQHTHNNFLNSMPTLQSKVNEWSVKYVALFQEDVIVATTGLIFVPTLRKFHYAYAQRGFLLDYNNKEIVATFTKEVKKYLQQHHISYLKLDPYVTYQLRDLNGDEIEGSLKNDIAITNLTDAGFNHLGFSVGYDDSKQCRWMSVLDLENKKPDILFNSFDPNTKRHIKLSQKYDVKIKELSYDELYILKDVVSNTGDRQDFSELPLSFYERQFNIYQDKVKAYCSYIDLKGSSEQAKQNIIELTQLNNEAKEELEKTPYSKKLTRSIKEYEQQLTKLNKDIDEYNNLSKEHGNILYLAAALFIYYGDEVIYLTSGSYDKYKKFKGPYALQWHVIQEALTLGYKKYNFYGISGYFKEDEEGYGVFNFKRGFKADIVELIGEFILPVNNISYQLLNTLNKI